MAAQRDKGGKFLKGHKGLKPKGSQTFTKLRSALKKEEPALIEATIDQAKTGNTVALNFLLTKMYGRAPFSDFKLVGKSITEVSEALLAAVGSVDPQTLQNASKLLESHLKVLEVEQFEKRLTALEEDKK